MASSWLFLPRYPSVSESGNPVGIPPVAQDVIPMIHSRAEEIAVGWIQGAVSPSANQNFLKFHCPLTSKVPTGELQ